MLRNLTIKGMAEEEGHGSVCIPHCEHSRFIQRGGRQRAHPTCLRGAQGGDGRLIENACRRCGQSVALRGPMGWLPDRLPTAYSLAL
jgi:hypothetical protein